jgi:hypothetical protein
MTCSRKGPNSSPIQNVPSGWRTIDSMSKSAPVSSRSRVLPWTIGELILCCGSRSEMNRLILTSPAPPFAVSNAGLTR